MNSQKNNGPDQQTRRDVTDPQRRSLMIAGATAPVWLPEWIGAAAAQTAPADPPTASDESVVMTVVYDNNTGPEQLQAKWGFGCLIRGKQKTILFDTGGEGWALMANLKELSIDPNDIDAIVLSHVHWDHVGGLPSLSAKRTGLRVYVPTGFPPGLLEHIRSLGHEPIEANDSTEVCTGVRTTGTLGHGAIEEHSLCVKTGRGWVMVTGCAHPGAHKLAAQAHKVTGGPIHAVFGGFHLLQKPDSLIDGITRRFEDLGVSLVGPTHCTGDPARDRFKTLLGDRCMLTGVGHAFRFPAVGGKGKRPPETPEKTG